MVSCGVIVTYIDWKKVKKWFFNIPLFVHQLVLIVMGTIFGKFKWPKASLPVRILSGFLICVGILAIPQAAIFSPWWVTLCWIVYILFGVATYRGIDWRKVWCAAQASHVRLCLKKMPITEARMYINFGYPEAKMEVWPMKWIDGKRFEYRDPTFDPSPEFIAAMIEYAEKQVGKGYDELQLLSNGLHLIAWIVWPWCWGKELKVIKAFNRKGGREHCISGVTACLRWGESAGHRLDVHRYFAKELNILLGLNETMFFPGYSTATTSPCLVPLSKNWEKK